MIEFKAPHFFKIHESVMKELMILGLISFSIFIGEEIFSIKNKDYFLELELTHIIIFFVALFYIMKAAWLLKILDDSRKVWDRACNMSYRSLRVVSQIFVVCFSMLWCLCTSCASRHTLHTLLPYTCTWPGL